MARYRLTDASANLVNGFTSIVTAVAKSAEEIPSIVHTFSKKYELSSKIELTEDIQESTIEGTITQKVTTVKDTVASLGWV